MALDPQIHDILDRVRRADHPAFWQLTPEQARESYRKSVTILDVAPAPLARVNDFAIRSRSGRDLPVRLYVPDARPQDGRGDLPAGPLAGSRAGQRLSGLGPAGAPSPDLPPEPLAVFFHGGGFTIGGLDTHDRVCRMIAARTPCRVLAVDYRLAPEHPFPAAVDDAWEALQWAHGNARRLGADPERMAVIGDSAGGTLAAVSSIRARDAGLALAHQVLVYPGTCGHQDTASHRQLTEGYLLDAKTIQWFFRHYLRTAADRDDWRFAPLDARPEPDLGDVAAATILVAGYDPLHDEGVAYAERLRAAGVAVELFDYPGMVHGFFNFGGAVDVARTAHADVVAALAKAFAPRVGPQR